MIFLVEGDNDTRSAITLLLECEALATRAFSSCDDLCQRVDPQSAECLILDIPLRGATGLELLERVHKENRALPVILMSGRLSAKIQDRATAAGAFAVLEKPFSGSQLVETVRRAIAAGYRPAGSC
jgi:two-component system, LuxR family, response regulator FixJ